MIGTLSGITRHLVASLVAILLASCASHEGTYSPSCAAYAGSNIELDNGQFVWEKFTDSVVVNDDGAVVNQFPGYPLQGSYRIDGESMILESAPGETVVTMYLLQHDGRSYLLTAEQQKDWKTAGLVADCALALGGNLDN